MCIIGVDVVIAVFVVRDVVAVFVAFADAAATAPPLSETSNAGFETRASAAGLCCCSSELR